LVEVVGGAKTSPEVLQQAMAFYASIGRKPIHIRKEIVGHVANRLQAALYRELAYLIDQDVVDVAAADDAVSWGPGLRWGVMGTLQEAADRPLEQIARERDDVLLGLIRLRRKVGNAPGHPARNPRSRKRP
jgi:3-hydroxyacyl-CoA dehydrogenase